MDNSALVVLVGLIGFYKTSRAIQQAYDDECITEREARELMAQLASDYPHGDVAFFELS